MQNTRVFWFTGLVSSGKSTLANALKKELDEKSIRCVILDGDVIRNGLNKDLGFSEADRHENVRRIGEVSKLMSDAGLVVIVAFISPLQADRDRVRQLFLKDEFIEVHVATPLEVCEQRDPKGLYKKVRAGVLKNFTGIDSPYEPPKHAEVTVDTSKTSITEALSMIVKHLN